MKVLLTTFLLAAITFGAMAQDVSKEELKAQREALKSEMKSEDYQKRQKKIAGLEAPKSTDVQSIDALANGSSSILLDVKKNNELLPELYKRTVGESLDGVTDVTVKKPTLEELTAVAMNIQSITSSVTAASAQIPVATTDLKGISPLKVGKALKSVNYSKDVLSLLTPELVYQSKMITNLISTLKSSGNL